MTRLLYTVVIVDDEVPLRRVLERSLSREGYRVVTAGSAEAAYALLATEQANALLLDIHLPTMSGLDRKSTRLNSSHVRISYAGFCLKKKKTNSTRDVHKPNSTTHYS